MVFLIKIREGRRASDGLVAQGISNSYSEHPLNATVAFNSQRLHEACKAKGVLELHLLQKEAAQLNSKYQANIPPDEMTVRQIQHNQFHVNPTNKTVDIASVYCTIKSHNQNDLNGHGVGYYTKNTGDLVMPYVGMKHDSIELSSSATSSSSSRQYKPETTTAQQIQKPPLQQQLMQHRLLQQKRQIFQKQVAMETALTRRQMLRQHSYKIAQQQQILPPLPLSECETEDLIEFQAIVEGTSSNCVTPTPSLAGSPKMMKTSHIQQNDCWTTLSGSMQTCQISDPMSHDNWPHPTMYQVYFMNE